MNMGSQKIACYTCDKCEVFFDKDKPETWQEPVETKDNNIYCKPCFRELHDDLKGEQIG